MKFLLFFSLSFPFFLAFPPPLLPDNHRPARFHSLRLFSLGIGVRSWSIYHSRVVYTRATYYISDGITRVKGQNAGSEEQEDEGRARGVWQSVS